MFIPSSRVRLRSAGFLLVSLAAAVQGIGAEKNEAVTLTPVTVVGTTPLAGIGLPRNQIPANVQAISSRQLEEAESLNLPDFMARQLPSVNVNEVQGNPFQPNVNFRGFTASPLLGTAQGLSVFVDGVRVNEAFGDTVNWELLPQSAIASLELIPGSNPLFGLNTLGGAISVHTKSGYTHAGTRAEISGGSFGRRTLELETGGKGQSLAWFMAVDHFKEDGWRDHSPSEATQFFGKLSHRNDAADFDLSLTRAVTKMTGNGLLPESMYDQRRSQIFTYPDTTRNDLTQITINGRWWLNDATSLSATVYHRQNRTRTLNGDVNDDFAGNPTLDGNAGANGGLGFNQDTGANNRTRTRQETSGVAGQWNYAGMQQQITVGVSHDHARSNFSQTAQLGILNAGRGIDPSAQSIEENSLTGHTRTTSLYASDTITLAPELHLTASARFNHSEVTTRDRLNFIPPNLDGDHSYNKLNPALGITWQAAASVNAYAGFNQGNRVPTPIELGCADPANPCTLPNALASDPFLKQVIARTLEAGVRGRLNGGLEWNAGVFRTTSYDDILFVGTSTSAGYFTNFGQTRRQGLELGLSGKAASVDWRINYSYLQATFQSSACLLSANNSSRGQSAACTANGQDDEILVNKGNRIPGLPEHSLKIGMNWHATDKIRLGADVQAFSSQYARGNENNQHHSGQATDTFGNTRDFEGSGRLPGYAILNLNAEIDVGRGWELFTKLNNVFDKRYGTAAALAENPFDASGRFHTNSSDWRRETFIAPGAPRAAWIGIRYQFGQGDRN